MTRCKISESHFIGRIRVAGKFGEWKDITTERSASIPNLIEKYNLSIDDIEYIQFCPHCGIKDRKYHLQTFRKDMLIQISDANKS